MKTKQEILDSYGLSFTGRGYDEDDAKSAMDEYAKQQAIAFNQHILGKLKIDKSTWAGQENYEYIMSVHANPDNHYAQFIEHQSQNK